MDKPIEVTDAELLPCPNPWCTSHDRSDSEIFEVHKPIIMPTSGWAVACPVCPMQTPYVATEGEAITAWNTRLAPTGEMGEFDRGLEAAAKVARRIGRERNGVTYQGYAHEIAAAIDALKGSAR